MSKKYDEIQDEIFDMIVEDVRQEEVEIEAQPVCYEHVLSFGNNDSIPNDTLAVFNMLPGCEYEFVNNISNDPELKVFMKAEPTEEYTNPYILFTLHRPTYMTVYWLAEYLSTRTELSMMLDRTYRISDRDKTIQYLLTNKYDEETIDRKLREHVQRICDTRQYESGMWKRIVKSTIKGRKTVTMHDFACDAVVKEKPWRGHQHEYDTNEMEQFCHDGKRYQWQYNHNKETDIKDARVLRSDLVVTDSHLHLIAQVADPRPWFRKWLTVDISKNGPYTSELISELRRLFYGRDVKVMMNKLKQHGSL